MSKRQQNWLDKGYTQEQINVHLRYEREKSKQSRERRKRNNEKNKEILKQIRKDLIEKTFNIIAVVPGSKYINNILGGALGLLEGSLFLGLIFYMISRYPFFGSNFSEMVRESIIIPWLNFAVDLILPILPQALKALQSLI